MSERWGVPDELAGTEEPQVETHFLEYWAVLLQRRRLILLCVFAALAIACLIAVFSKPAYQATVVLALEKGGRQLDSTSLETGGNQWDPEFLPTQIELIKSREIAERVVKRLKLIDNPNYRSTKSGFFRVSGEKGPRADRRGENHRPGSRHSKRDGFPGGQGHRHRQALCHRPHTQARRGHCQRRRGQLRGMERGVRLSGRRASLVLSRDGNRAVEKRHCRERPPAPRLREAKRHRLLRSTGQCLKSRVIQSRLLVGRRGPNRQGSAFLRAAQRTLGAP